MEYVIIDIETTGLDIQNSAIIEVGAILVEGSTVKGEYHSFVQYDSELPLEIKRLTGITDDILKGAPSVERVLSELKSFIAKCPVVAHNGFNFDFPILESRGLKFTEKHDSMEFAFFILPTNHKGHSVRALAHFFELGEEKHRALDDCKLQHEIIKNLSQFYTKRRKDRRESLKYVASTINWWWTQFLLGEIRPFFSITDLVDKYEPYKKESPEQNRLSLIGDIDTSKIESYFQKVGGKVTEAYSEDRPEQRRMATDISEAFNTEKHTVIEAGTGTGKSKAYLVPSVLFALKNNVPVIIATFTKALQEQLFNKEIPHIKEIISQDIHVSLLMGKTNYVCLKKFEESFQEIYQQSLDRSLYEFRSEGVRFTSRLSYLLLASWICETKRGDWEEVPYWLKERMPKKIESEIRNLDELCDKEACELYDEQKCFLAKARMAARDSDLIIINHALALMGIIEEEIALAPDNPEAPEAKKQYSHTVFPSEAKYIVFDEAHHLEDAATSAWEYVISKVSMNLLLEQLYGVRGIKRYIEAYARRDVDNPFLSSYNLFMNSEQKLRVLVDILFTKALPMAVPFDAETQYKQTKRVELLRQEGKWEFIEKVLSDIFDLLKFTNHSLSYINEHVEDERLKNKIKIRVKGMSRILKKIEVMLDNKKTYVRYLEHSNQELSIKAALISVSQKLKDFVYDNYITITTSATLQVGNDFSFFANRCGTGLIEKEKITYKCYPSSFDYREQVQFFVPKGIVYESKNNAEHLDSCVSLLKSMVIASNGGSLILCSSHSQIEKIYQELKDTLDKANIYLLRQHQGTGITSKVEAFKGDINSVLIGTKALWQGIDVPGESLRSLFIIKIPFRYFGDPIIRARCEAIDDTGHSSYELYYEPLAALELKQGFGRLIRKRTDRGIVVLFDEKLMSRPRILSSLPDGVTPVKAEPNDIVRELHNLAVNK
ncbi:3'-5' exoribonuclease [Patescibacteria group bacterium]|nr:3'-5' exoribonuclease [Patescibacteria group bacterium]